MKRVDSFWQFNGRETSLPLSIESRVGASGAAIFTVEIVHSIDLIPSTPSFITIRCTPTITSTQLIQSKSSRNDTQLIRLTKRMARKIKSIYYLIVIY